MKLKKVIRTILIVLLATIICVAVHVGIYKNPGHKKIEDAGIIEKQAQVGEVNFNYAEGPDNGPALVLLHAQLLDWFTYNKVLPDLSEHFHVYAIDYPGHGKTTYPDNYEMSADNIGESLKQFIYEIIGEDVYVSGNSSGGLLTVWLAVNAPETVKAVVLEDPPLFSSEYPKIKETIAYRSFITSDKALKEGYDGDFLMYWVTNSTEFFNNYVFKGAQSMVKALISYCRLFNSEGPLEMAFVPPVVQEMLRGLDMYDPAFGAAFYSGTWNEGFDHESSLRQIECPALLIQADTSYMEDGTLNGAMSEDMAMKAMSCLADGKYVKLDSNHVTNLDASDQFTQLLIDFFLNGEITQEQ